MAKTILIDEFHLSVLALRGLSDAEYRAIRRTLQHTRFYARLRDAVGGVFRKYPKLANVKVRISR